MSKLTRDEIAEPVSRGQILRHERGQGNIHFSCLADHVQDWQPYAVDPYSCSMCDHTYIHAYMGDDTRYLELHAWHLLSIRYTTYSLPFSLCNPSTCLYMPLTISSPVIHSLYRPSLHISKTTSHPVFVFLTFFVLSPFFSSSFFFLFFSSGVGTVPPRLTFARRS